MITADIDTRELEAYRKTLALYLQLNQRDVGEIARRKGNDLRVAMYQSFRALAPAKGESLREAHARGWRVRRASSTGGLSAVAQRRARARMGGHESILVSSVTEKDGKIELRGVRASKSGKRVSGGRHNRWGQAVSGRNRLLRQSGDRILNARAVAVIEEINLRERSRTAAAVGWLAGRRTLRRKDIGRSAREVVRNRTGIQVGDMTWSDDGTRAMVQFTNRLQAAQAVAARGAVAVGMRSASRDMRDYIERKVRGTILESGVAQ
jgi:hypothetical protein